MIYGNDENLFREIIQTRIAEQEKNRNDRIYIEPIQMQNGRERDLNLANIIICEPLRPTDNDKVSYQYLLNKKFEELTLDRLGQLKKTIRDNSNFYCLEIYLKKYEEQSGSKLSEIQIQAIRNLNQKIQEGVIIGKYNLKDYITFLQSLPDLLSRKKILGFGSLDKEEFFWKKGEIDELLISVEDISNYNTYIYRRLHYGESRISNDKYKIISSPSINYRMRPNFGKLCCIDVTDNKINFFSSEAQEAVKGLPNKKHVGKGIHYNIYSDNSGILFAGGSYSNIKEQQNISAHDIAIDLAEISREGLIEEAQIHLIESVDENMEKDEKSK